MGRHLNEPLDQKAAKEMLRAVARPGDDPDHVPKERLRHMLPPLYPAHALRRNDLVFGAGETDPVFYILLEGDVLISHQFLLRPRSGFAGAGSGRELSLGLHRLRPGESFGETEILEGAGDKTLPRASTATCASTACALLAAPGRAMTPALETIPTPQKRSSPRFVARAGARPPLPVVGRSLLRRPRADP